MFSNKYIFVYTSVMVIVVAAILALAATLLHPKQEENIQIEKQQYILSAAGISSTTQNAVALYNQNIKAEFLLDEAGNILSHYTFDGKDWTEKDGRNEKRAFFSNESGKNAVFVCGEGEDIAYILPMKGNGLWGPIWGYIALGADANTVKGVVFDHKGETPGLGAEIANPKYQAQFQGKKIFNEQGEFVSITVQKGGVARFTGNPDNAVDAISGGTITSKGLSKMLSEEIGKYVGYLKSVSTVR